ncbi:transcriptional regulator protein [Sphaerotilus natans subsp. natans DSM 6575]|jgi:DNA-binding transcriptional LysR family regulator|uniref:Transcriptional regulator protein n=1 Tax=Sphaerotilus natans subsp. natans DSM 6575 TaxID=1286631 RepID=A0A059KH12_9BURK|nr:LysR family transcriptional regulator [Sphaerotilus natans]KDB50650.1 transcriptional regulator protein [Sphaerotilus natans subsp. natans DSM 6575]SIQ06246.1 DNA-binding transcriptional regulator, LysR family [Sphaerotilus natans]
MDLLNDMALFVEVARAMSFRRAAEALGMPNSTLSRRVSALEKAIGLRLMHRTTRRLELTEAGQLYYERCKRIVEEARLAHEQLGELLAQPSGVLRASLPVDFANSTLAPLIAEFARRHPGIRFEFDLTPRRVDLVSEPFDVAIRMGASQDSTLVARLLATLDTHLYASPAYVSRVGPPRQPADLARHEGLLFKAGGGRSTWRLSRTNGSAEEVEIEVGGRFQLNSVGLLRRLAMQDLGVALLADVVVADDLAAGRLQRVLPDWQGPPIPVYAMTETRLLPAKTQRFIEFLREKLGQAAA